MDIPYPAASCTGSLSLVLPPTGCWGHCPPPPKPLGSPLGLAEPRNQQSPSEGAGRVHPAGRQSAHRAPSLHSHGDGKGRARPARHGTATRRVKGDPTRTLLPSSMMTTSFWAYSWISVSQACGAVRLRRGERYPRPSPQPARPPRRLGKRLFFLAWEPFQHHSRTVLKTPRLLATAQAYT